MKNGNVAFVLLLLMLGFSLRGLGKTPVDDVRGFRAYPKLDNTTNPATFLGYTFCPLCIVDKVTKKIDTCSIGQLHAYNFEWKFSDNDYSVQKQPFRSFNSPPSKVTMRETGIKTDDERACIGGGQAMCTYQLLVDPADWTVKDFVESTTLAATPSAMVANEYASYFKFATHFKAVIAPPFCMPVWKATMIYPIVFYNPEETCMSFKATVGHSIFDTRKLSFKSFPVQPDNFLPNMLVSSKQLNANQISITAMMAPHSSLVVLFRAILPMDHQDLDSNQHKLQLNIACKDADFGTKCGCPENETFERIDNIVSTIDPNKKWIVGSQRKFIEGERVHFALQFMNTGSASETVMYVEDLLDERFDADNVHFDQLEIRSRTLPMRKMKIKGESKTLLQDGKTLLRMMLSGDSDHAISLEPGDSGIVFFDVPIKEFEPVAASMPAWLTKGDTIYEEIPNAAFTMFQGEGKVYEAHCLPYGPMVAHAVQVPNALFWVLIILLLLLILWLIFWFFRRKLAMRAIINSSLNPPSA